MCAQYQKLQHEFPRTLSNLEHFFLPSLPHAVTDDKGHNPAGYVLWQLRKAAGHARSLHGEVRGCLPICDSEFASEVRWHAEQKTQFRNLIPALGACWYNLVHERGERFRELSQSTLSQSQRPSLPAVDRSFSIGEILDVGQTSRPLRVG